MAEDKKFVEAITSMDVDFAQWYTDVVKKAELMGYSSVKGCMIFKPAGYAIWENIKAELDKRFKETGVENVYMPMFIPESLLQREKDHVEGFAPEVAWVTYGGLNPLQERMCVRPTSETLFCDFYKDEIQSYRDLPKVYNQWCSVVRWEKETRPFLRSREFLWQEGHTVHSTPEEAKTRTIMMLDIYSDVIENLLAIPVIKGKKTEKEKFAGAEDTYTVETLMHDGRALQAGTSHYFGQNFSKPFGIKFQNKDGKEEYAYQTSWGISTRLIGATIMAHGDNRGLKLPPRVAPIQAVVIPIAMHKPGVKNKAEEISKTLSQEYRIKCDTREDYTPGYKFNEWEMKGVPVRIEIGPKDIEKGECVFVRRDTFEKIAVKFEDVGKRLGKVLEAIQENMYEECKRNMEKRTTTANNLDEFVEKINTNQGFIKTMWCGKQECEDKIKELTGAHSRCMPFNQEQIGDKCVCCGAPAKIYMIWGRQY